MADKKLSERNEATTRTGGYLHIIKPNGLLFDSYKILESNLLDGCPTITKLTNKTGTQIITIPANCWVESAYLKIASGTPSVKIGINGNLTKYLDTTEITSRMKTLIQDEFETQDDLYITISGGNVNIRLELIYNY